MQKKYKPAKDKKKHIVKKMQNTEGLNHGFGEYNENTGGGHPFEAGNSNTRTTKENGKLRQSENAGKTQQPRTDDGKFTYKSVNGKSIDPKYGPSRGVTVPPILTGGENGIKIENVKGQFKTQSGEYWDKYKDKWYQKGGKVITQGLSTKISAKDVWEMAKEYDSSIGEFRYREGDNEDGSPKFSTEKDQWQTKGGKKSQAEMEAIKKAHDTKEQQYAINAKTGAIENKGGEKMNKAIKEFVKAKQEPVAPAKSEIGNEPATQEQEQPEQPVAAENKPNPEDEKPWGSGKYNIGQKNAALNTIKKELGAEFDESFWDDANLEEFIEQNPSILG